MKKQNVLISSAGRRVSLVRDFRNSLQRFFPDAKVFTSDANPEFSAACRFSDGYYKVPRINNEGFIPSLLDYCKQMDVGMVIPTIDTELLIFAENRLLFESEGIQLIVSDLDLIQSCRNKRLTHELFCSYGLNHAKEVDPTSADYPIFSKPEGGSSSIGIHVFQSLNDISEKLMHEKGRMFLEYLNPADHKEFTVDLYYDIKSQLKCIVPRERIEVRSGEVNKGITRKNDLIPLLSDKLSTLKGARGCITLQLFMNRKNGHVTGIEINPRFGGGYPLSYAAGAHFPDFLIREYYEKKDVLFYNNWEANLLMLRYDNEVLVHEAANK